MLLMLAVAFGAAIALYSKGRSNRRGARDQPRFVRMNAGGDGQAKLAGHAQRPAMALLLVRAAHDQHAVTPGTRARATTASRSAAKVPSRHGAIDLGNRSTFPGRWRTSLRARG
jgi:hypothetical protein